MLPLPSSYGQCVIGRLDAGWTIGKSDAWETGAPPIGTVED